MAVTTTKTNKPINPRGNDQSPLAFNRAKLYSGKALDFDGVNDNVALYDATAIWTGDFSVSWYGDLDATGNFFAFSSGTYTATGQAGINFWYGGASNKNFSAHFPETDGTGQQGYNLTLGESYEYWHRIDLVFVSSSRLLSLYQNGILVDTATIASNVDAAYMPNGWEFGRSYGGSFPLNGKLTNLKAFNTALTAAQVSDLYNNPEKIVPTGVEDTALKLWLPMMEGAGTTAYDGSGNGNHGTISGATYVNGVGAPVAQSAVIDWNKGSNLALYSEEIDNAYYSVNNVSKSANQTTAPDGTQTADLITGTGTNDHYIYNVGIGLTGQNTISVFAKYNGYNIGIRPQGIGSGQAFANFDLQNGTILGSGGTSYDDSSITSFGDGWYRISLTLTYATSYGFGTYVVKGTTATELPYFTADGTSGHYVWGMQVSAGATLTPYVRTGATAQTSPVLLPQGLTSGRDITGVNLFENVRKQGALNLDGNSWAEVHDNASLDMTTTATMEAWVNCDDLVAAYQIIMVKSSATSWTGSYGRYVLRANQNNVNWWFDDFTANTKYYTISLSGYNHLVVTKDGTTEKLYINGALVDTETGAATFTASPYSLVIGAQSSYAENWDNQLAQPRIYNRALTAEEVERNYNAGKNTYKN